MTATVGAGMVGRRWTTWTAAGALALVAATARPADAQLAKVETPEIRIVYLKGTETFLVPFATQSFLNSLRFHESLFGFKPSQKPTVLLLDFQDYGNAFAGSVPRDTVQVQIAPLSYLFETISANERMTMIANHELVHVATMDGAAASDRFFRHLFFGKVNPVATQPESVLYFYLTSPRVATPRWYEEGIAVFVDTWMDGGLGRAQSGYDEMVFRAMVKDNARFYDPLGLVAEGTKADFQVEVNSYLYGTRFMTYLAYHYSPEKVIEWTSRKPGSRAYYASQFKQVFGTSLDAAWSDWIAFEHQFQQENLAAIRKYPVTESKDLSPRALGSISRAYYDQKNGKIYAAFNYPGVVAHLGAISTSTGAVEHLVDVKGPRIYQVASLTWDDTTNALYYTTDNVGLRDLVKYDLATGRHTTLQKDLRVGDLAMNHADGSMWGIRHLNGICSIVRMAPPFKDWTRVVSLPYGTVIYDLDVSPDGTQVVVGWGEINGHQSVRVLSINALQKGNTTPVAQFDFGGNAVPSGFVFSPDGRYLYGSSYYTGASNIFRYDLAAKKLDAMTNADTGFFRPLPLGGDDLLVFRFTGAGFVPARITAHPLQDVSAITFLGQKTIEAHPVLKDWAVGSPQNIPYDTLPKTEGTYGLAGGLGLESLYPILQGYKNTGAIGARVNFSDPLQLNGANLAVSYSPTSAVPMKERLHVSGEYVRYDWTAQASWNNADFYDLFGPTKVSRKGYRASLKHTNVLIFDQPRRMDLSVEAVAAGQLDQLPEYQNIPVKVDKLYSLNADLTYTDVRSSLGHVDDEKGQTWSVSFRGNYVNSKPFARTYATYDRGFALPLPHSSIWIRSAAGFSAQDRAQPFANFFFGGFGNNYIDHADQQRYRQYYSFPGVELNAIGGRNFARTMVEWNLPPVRFSRVGTPGAYLSFIRPAIFVSGLVTNLDDNPTQERALTLGGQLDFRFTIISSLDMTLSVGGGIARLRDGSTHREAMVSLCVLR